MAFGGAYFLAETELDVGIGESAAGDFGSGSEGSGAGLLGAGGVGGRVSDGGGTVWVSGAG